MSSVSITIANIRFIAEALAAKGYHADDFTIKIIDAGPEITIRDANDMFITNFKKPAAEIDENNIPKTKKGLL